MVMVEGEFDEVQARVMSGIVGVFWRKAIVMTSLSGLRRARHWHVLGVQMHGYSQCGIVSLGGGGVPR